MSKNEQIGDSGHSGDSGDSNDEFTVDKILDRRERNGRVSFRQFFNYYSDVSWIPNSISSGIINIL